MFVTKSTAHCAVVQRSLEVSKNVLTLCKTSIAPRTLFLSTFRSCLLPCLKIFFLIHAAYSQVSETKVKEFSLFTEPLLISIKEWFIFIYHLMIDILTDVHQSQQVSSERLRRTLNWELSPFSDLNLSANYRG